MRQSNGLLTPSLATFGMLLVGLMLLLPGCEAGRPTPVPTGTPTAMPTTAAAPTAIPTIVPVPTATGIPPATPTTIPTATAVPTATPSPAPPEASRELKVIGALNIAAGPEHITDVWALAAANGKSYAYLGSYDRPYCSPDITGVHIVDITRPSEPVKTGMVPAPPDLRISDVNAVHIRTPFFNGDLLAFSVELCREARVEGAAVKSPAVMLYDVTDPLTPRRLAAGFSLGFEAHNLFVYQQGERAYVAIVEDNGERDFHIVDITDPDAPKEVSARGRPDWFGPGDQLMLGAFPESFLHDVWVRSYPAGLPNRNYDGKTIAYLSYWDAGLVILDVTDPANPVFLGDSDYLDPDPVSRQPPEGNSHSAVPTEDGNLVFMGDEDFSPSRLVFSVDTAEPRVFPASEASFTRPLSELPGGLLSGTAVYVGQACSVATIPPPPRAGVASDTKFIALIERGVCAFEDKVSNAAAAGYDAAIVFSSADAPDEVIALSGDRAKGVIPALSVPRSAAFSILGLPPDSPAGMPLPAPGTIGQKVSARSISDGWGYGRILDVSDPANIRELGQFATGNAIKSPSSPGDYSIHNMMLKGRRAYISWYADGMRVVDFSTPEAPREIGYFVDRVKGSDFWGVYLFAHPDGNTYMLGSDRSTGLWIFEAP